MNLPKEVDRSLRLYADGSARPNPGNKTIAVVDEKGIVLVAENVGYGTNHEAEYLAAIKAMELALIFVVPKLTLHIDSKLVYNQVWGTWKTDKKFYEYVRKIKELESKFPEGLTVIPLDSKDNPAHEVCYAFQNR